MRVLFRSLLTAIILTMASGSARADDWPQWLGPQRDGVWRETGLIDKLPTGGPRVLWRVPVADGYAGPAVAAGRVYVFDYVSKGDKAPGPDKRNDLTGQERVQCLDALTGQPIWKHDYACSYHISYPAGPRCTPTVSGGKVYTLGAEGNLCCFDAANGSIVWSRELKKDYKLKESQTWGFAAHPLVDGQKLICIVGGEDSVAVALDKDTGKELWRALSAKDAGYCPPTIIEAAGKRQLIIWHGQAINGLDPETGKVWWSVDHAPNYGMAIAAPRRSGDYLFASAIHNKSALLKLTADKPGAELVWTSDPKTSLDAVTVTPFIEGDVIYGCDAHGQLRAVDLKTGVRLWESFVPTTGGKQLGNGTAFFVKNGDRYVLFNELGELIFAKFNRQRYQEISRAKLLEPTGETWGRAVVWSHPAFANKCVYVRNDKELICVSLAAATAKK